MFPSRLCRNRSAGGCRSCCNTLQRFEFSDIVNEVRRPPCVLRAPGHDFRNDKLASLFSAVNLSVTNTNIQLAVMAAALHGRGNVLLLVIVIQAFDIVRGRASTLTSGFDSRLVVFTTMKGFHCVGSRPSLKRKLIIHK